MKKPTRKQTSAVMHNDAGRAFVEMNAGLQGYSPEDVTKLYDAYGPYATDLFRTAFLTPVEIRSVMKPTLVSTENFSITPATKELLDTVNGNKPRLTNEQIARIVNKPEMEVAANIAEYQKQEEARKQIDATYQTINGGQNKPTTSVESLLSAGVTPEDFQAVMDADPELAHNIGGGPTCKKNLANINVGLDPNAKSSCLKSCQKIIPDSLGRTSFNDIAYNEYRNDRTWQGSINGGCAAYTVLDHSGDYISVGMKNKAYKKTKNSKEDKEMNEYVRQVRPGCVVSWDCIDDTETRLALGNTNGGKWGHVCVMGPVLPDGKSEGYSYLRQKTFNNPRYGEELHISFPKDAEVSEEYAKLLIEHAQQRTGQCLNVEENRKAYEASQKASKSAQKTRTKTATQQTETTKQQKGNSGKSTHTSSSKSASTASKGSSGR